MHQQLIDYISRSATEVFSTMFGQELAVGPSIENSKDSGPTSGVAAMVGIAGKVAGTGSVVCTEEVACRLSSLMLMTELDSMSADVLDAMGEIANMIVGNVKTLLEEKAGPLGLSTPTVVHGSDFGARTSPGQGWTIVNFTLPGGERFRVQMALTSQ